jgi:phage-related protein
LTLEELNVIIDAKLDPYKKAMSDMKKVTEQATKPVKDNIKSVNDTVNHQTGGIRNALMGLGKIAAFGLLAKKMYDFGKYSVQTALEVSASMNQIRRLMGESTQSFLKWSKGGALAYNLATGDAIKYGAVYSNLFSNFIKDNDQLAGYTVQMLKTSAVVASATGRTMDDVMNRIRSGMLGSTEAIEDLGINVNVSMLKTTKAFQELANGRSWEQLDFNTQQAIRMMGILEQASTKFGNTLMQGPTTSIAYFIALLKNAALNIGNAFLPVIQAIMPALNAFASVVNKATGALAVFMQLLFGKKASASPMSSMANDVKNVGGGLDKANNGAGKLGKGLGGAGKQAKALKKELLGLMGFDEINLLNKDKSDSGGGSGGGGGGGGGSGAGGGGGITLPKVSFDDNLVDEDNSAILKLIEKIKAGIEYLNGLLKLFGEGFKNAFRFDGLDKLKTSLEGIGQSLSDIFSDGKVAKAVDRYLKALSYALGQATGAISNIALAGAIFFAESFNKSLKETKLEIKSFLIRYFTMSAEIATAVGNLARDISNIFYNVFTSEGATKIGSAVISAFTYAFTKATIVIGALERDLVVGIGKIIGNNKKVITDAIVGTLDAIAPIFDTLKTIVKDVFSGIVALYDEHISPLITSILEGISQITNSLFEGYNTYILPILTEFGEKFQGMYGEYLKPILDEIFAILGQLIDVINILWQNVLVPVIDWIAKAIMPVLSPIIKYLTETVLYMFKVLGATIQTFLKILRGLIDFIVGVFTGDWSKAWDGIKAIFEGVWNVIKLITKAVWEFIWGLISSIVTKIYNWISEKFTAIRNFVSDIWNSIKSIISSVLRGMWSAVTSKMSDIYNAVASWFGKIPSTVSNLWNSAIDCIRSVNLYSIGRSVISGLVNGIGSMARDVWEKAKSIARGIGNSIKSALGINSPSKLTTSFGRFIGQGLYLGMDKEETNVFNSAKSLNNSVLKGINNSDISVDKNVNVDIFADFKNTMGTMLNSLANMKNNALSGSGDIILQIGDTEFGRFAINKINEEQERAGMTLIKV